MILHSYLFKRVTIVGVGMMGGSLGLALKKHKIAREVIGLSNRQSSLMSAMKAKVIDTAETDIAKAVKNADLIILAAPVDAIIHLLSAINPHLKRGCIITDLGSAKSAIVDEANRVLSNPGNFVGSHPIVGSEKKGVEGAQDDLFEGAKCIMTPSSTTNNAVADKVKKMWAKIGATVKDMTPSEHDKILAQISHLPHIAAFSMMNAISDEYLELASNGLKDTTRVAGSSSQMWNDICMSNAKNVINVLDAFVAELAKVRLAIVNRDKIRLTECFEKAKEKREKLN